MLSLYTTYIIIYLNVFLFLAECVCKLLVTELFKLESYVSMFVCVPHPIPIAILIPSDIMFNGVLVLLAPIDLQSDKKHTQKSRFTSNRKNETARAGAR